MATPVLMPKQGQSVESCIIVSWKKQKGDPVSEGETLCEVETDKAVMEVESPVGGTFLGSFYEEGDDVPVMVNIAVIGEPSEDPEPFRPAGESKAAEPQPASPGSNGSNGHAAGSDVSPAPQPATNFADASVAQGNAPVSPRARKLAEAKGVDATLLAGSGPKGRVIERDIQAALEGRAPLSPAAKARLGSGGLQAPGEGRGIGGRVLADDLLAGATGIAASMSTADAAAQVAPGADLHDQTETIKVKGVRKLIADRMLASLQTTAQLTLNSSADARAAQALRKRFKSSDESLGLQKVTLNDMVLYAVSRALQSFPEMNALFQGDTITRYANVHLGFAVDTPRGLMVPVVRNAQILSLRALASEGKRLAAACLKGGVTPEELGGGTFTVTNLGHLGVEHFTPVLNPPQVGILGVSNITLQPVQEEGEVRFLPRMGLSLTINHQVVDGAPAARFLQAVANGIGNMDLLLAQ